MTYKELCSALDLHKKIERMEANLVDLRATGGVGSIGANTPVMGGSKDYPGQLCLEQEQEIAELRQLLMVESAIIHRFIDKLHLKDIERKIMLLRYVDCVQWKALSMIIGYSRSWTLQFHSDALKKSGLDWTPPDLTGVVKCDKM